MQKEQGLCYYTDIHDYLCHRKHPTNTRRSGTQFTRDTDKVYPDDTRLRGTLHNRSIIVPRPGTQAFHPKNLTTDLIQRNVGRLSTRQGPRTYYIPFVPLSP